jgi:integrase
MQSLPGALNEIPLAPFVGALSSAKGEHFAAVTEPKQVSEIFRAIDGYEGSLIVGCALRLAPLVFVRPGELRNAEWADIDFDKLEWRYILTKTDTQHIVALSPHNVPQKYKYSACLTIYLTSK